VIIEVREGHTIEDLSKVDDISYARYYFVNRAPMGFGDFMYGTTIGIPNLKIRDVEGFDGECFKKIFLDRPPNLLLQIGTMRDKNFSERRGIY
jgi:hypothetical protein